MRVQVRAIFLTILICLWASGAWGATVYVKKISSTVYYESGASSCDDVTDADSSGDLQNAIGAAGEDGTIYVCTSLSGTDFDADSTAVLQAGQTMYLTRGITLTAGADQLLTMANNTTLTSTGSGDLPILDGGQQSNGYTLVAGGNAADFTISYIKFQNCENAIRQNAGVEQSTKDNRTITECEFESVGTTAEMGSGIFFDGGSGIKGDTITNCSFTDTKNTVIKLGRESTFYQRNTRISGCTFYQCDYDDGDSSEGHVIDVCRGGQNIKIYDNLFQECGYNNGNPTYSSLIISVDGCRGAEIFNNWFMDNYLGCIELMAQGNESTGHLIYANLMSNNGFTTAVAGKNYIASAFHIVNSMGVANDFNSLIANNTIYNQQLPDVSDIGVVNVRGSTNDDDVSGLTIYNNICLDHYEEWISELQVAGTPTLTVTADYNNYTSSNGGTAGDATGGNDITTDPELYAVGSDNYCLKPSSPAGNSGVGMHSATEIHTEANAAADNDAEVNGVAGWSAGTGGAFSGTALESSSTKAAVGTYALHAVAGGDGEEYVYNTTVTSGKILTVGFWIYSTGGTGDDEDIEIEIGTSEGDTTYEDVTVTTDDEWEYHRYVFTTSSADLYITIRECDGDDDNDAEFYLDDLSIRGIGLLAPRSSWPSAVYTADADDLVQIGGANSGKWPIGCFAPADYLYTASGDVTNTIFKHDGAGNNADWIVHTPNGTSMSFKHCLFEGLVYLSEAGDHYNNIFKVLVLDEATADDTINLYNCAFFESESETADRLQ